MEEKGVKRVPPSLKKAEAAAAVCERITTKRGDTDALERALIRLASLLEEAVNELQGVEVIDVNEAASSLSKIATAHARLIESRAKSSAALEAAKSLIKEELREAIQNDEGLLSRLYKIVEGVKQK